MEGETMIPAGRWVAQAAQDRVYETAIRRRSAAEKRTYLDANPGI